MPNKRILIKVVPVLLLLSIAAFWYFSPYLALHAMRNAAKEHDAAALAKHVDFPKVREDLKVQMHAMMADSVRGLGGDGNEFARAGAAFGAMLASLMTDKMVDAMITPEALAHSMREGKMAGLGQARPSNGEDGGADSAPATQWSFERDGVDRLVARAVERDDKPGIGFVLQREGFAQWKLVAIELPKPRR